MAYFRIDDAIRLLTENPGISAFEFVRTLAPTLLEDGVAMDPEYLMRGLEKKGLARSAKLSDGRIGWFVGAQFDGERN
jgi:hypothetical protein